MNFLSIIILIKRVEREPQTLSRSSVLASNPLNNVMSAMAIPVRLVFVLCFQNRKKEKSWEVHYK